jgi:hypothetical protein
MKRPFEVRIKSLGLASKYYQIEYTEYWFFGLFKTWVTIEQYHYLKGDVSYAGLCWTRWLGTYQEAIVFAKTLTSYEKVEEYNQRQLAIEEESEKRYAEYLKKVRPVKVKQIL